MMCQSPTASGRRCFAAWACLCLIVGCGEPPQLGGDAATLKSADALWTAVSSQDKERLAQSAARMAELHSAGTLPDVGYAYLQEIVATAESGNWSGARERLRKLIKAQRHAR